MDSEYAVFRWKECGDNPFDNENTDRTDFTRLLITIPGESVVIHVRYSGLVQYYKVSPGVDIVDSDCWERII